MQSILTVLLIMCCQSVYSLGNNGTNRSLLNSSIDITYTIVNLNEAETSSNSSIELKDNNLTTNSDVNSSTTSYYSNNFFKNIMSGIYFDSYTLILVFAFLIGLIIISLFICCAICICKRGKTRTKTPGTKITNPLYDKTDIEFKQINQEDVQPNDVDSAEKEQLLNSNQSDQTTLKVDNKNLNDSSLLNSTSSCSTSSINSVVLRPVTPPKLNETDSTLKKEENSIEESKQVTNFNHPTVSPSQINETPTRSDITDQTDKKVEPLLKRFTPNSYTKSQQQLFQERKLTDSKMSVYKRASSQINDLNESNRLSVGSSRASIQQEINFDLIKGDIDDLVLKNDPFASRSESSQNSSHNINMERAESFGDIYMREFISITNKRRALQNDVSLSSNSVQSNFDKKSRRSMNIPFNPNASDVTTNLDKNNSVSGCTIASEKSCY